MVDTQGILLAVSVQAGDVQDRNRAKEKLATARAAIRAFLWSERTPAGALVDWVASHYGWTLEIVRKSEDQNDVKGFAVLPHRWIVERTFAWLFKYRRLVFNYAFLTEK